MPGKIALGLGLVQYPDGTVLLLPDAGEQRRAGRPAPGSAHIDRRLDACEPGIDAGKHGNAVFHQARRHRL